MAGLTGLFWFGSGRAEGGLDLAALSRSPTSLDAVGMTVAAIIACIALNALFIAADTAMDVLKPLHVKAVREANPRLADRLERVIENRSRLVAASSFGSQLCRFAMVVGAFALAPAGLSFARGEQAGAVVGDLLLAGVLFALPIGLVNLVFGELVPKSYAALRVQQVAGGLLPFASFFAALLGPAILLVTATANLISRRYGATATFAVANQAEEEIREIVESAEQSGELEEEEREMLHSVFEFSDTVAREVMTPRIDLDALPIESDVEEVIRVIEESGHSRIPLYERTDDQIVGVIHAKDLLLARLQGEVDLRSLLRQPLFVPENKDLHELLKEMRQSRSQIAVVQDEFGGTAGIVTIEDIVEELVGDIVDEYDVEEPEIVSDGDTFLVSGKAHLDDVNDEVGSEFESDEFDTAGGFVFGLFGYQPKQGESLEVSGYRFTVEETDGRRIHKLRLRKLEDSDEGQEPD
ncbi:MAG: HlyC/CorC family transporter [Fimbriimonadaceae bacterium]|nr:HlyC/CorC family transporter [Fimbriimonadaceae bacterium]